MYFLADALYMRRQKEQQITSYILRILSESEQRAINKERGRKHVVVLLRQRVWVRQGSAFFLIAGVR